MLLRCTHLDEGKEVDVQVGCTVIKPSLLLVVPALEGSNVDVMPAEGDPTFPQICRRVAVAAFLGSMQIYL